MLPKISAGFDHADFPIGRIIVKRSLVADHDIDGIGDNVDGLANNLTGHRDAGMTHVDSRKPGTTARRDETRADFDGRCVTIVQNAYMVHAYHQSLDEFNSRFNPLK